MLLEERNDATTDLGGLVFAFFLVQFVRASFA